MAQSRRPEAEARDGSSSEEEEEEEGSEEENQEQEESESESEEEEDKTSTPVPKKSSAPKKPETTQTLAHPQPSSSDDSSSESDSESDSPPNSTRRADPNIKPIASKPMEEPPKATKKPRSKPSSATPAVKSSTSAVKRQVESEIVSTPETKKAKRKAAADVDRGIEEDTAKKGRDDSKKQLFQRLWSEEDEIAILKGMIEYTAKKGADPVADMNAFHDFIKKSLHVDVSKTQLSDKVRRLRKKYENNSTKGKKGEDRTFSKPHEQKAYELSKNIWGGEANDVGVDSTKFNGKARKNQNQNQNHIQRASVASLKVAGLALPDKVKEGTKTEVELNSGASLSVRFNRSIGESSLEEEIVKDGLELISGPKKSELEEKWKKLRVEEVELYLKRVDLIREQTKLVLEALKSSGH